MKRLQRPPQELLLRRFVLVWRKERGFCFFWCSLLVIQRTRLQKRLSAIPQTVNDIFLIDHYILLSSSSTNKQPLPPDVLPWHFSAPGLDILILIRCGQLCVRLVRLGTCFQPFLQFFLQQELLNITQVKLCLAKYVDSSCSLYTEFLQAKFLFFLLALVI